MAFRAFVGLQIVMLSERPWKEKPHSSLLGRILHRSDEGRGSVRGLHVKLFMRTEVQIPPLHPYKKLDEAACVFNYSAGGQRQEDLRGH